jgi:hypothetical protein
VSAGGRSALHPVIEGLFGALVRQQVQSGEAASAGKPIASELATAGNRVAAPSLASGATNPKSVLLAELASNVASGLPQPKIGAMRVHPGPAVADPSTVAGPASEKLEKFPSAGTSAIGPAKDAEDAEGAVRAERPVQTVSAKLSPVERTAVTKGKTATGMAGGITGRLAVPGVEKQSATTAERPMIGVQCPDSAIEERAGAEAKVSAMIATGQVAAKGNAPLEQPAATADTPGPDGSEETGTQNIGNAGSASRITVLEASADRMAPALSKKTSLPIRSIEPVGERTEGAPRAAIVDHHERKIPQRLPAFSHAPTESLPTAQEALAGVAVSAAGNPGAGTATAGPLLSAAAPGVSTNEAKADPPSNRTTPTRWTGSNLATAPTDGRASKEPGDAQNISDSESRVIPAERRVHAESTLERPPEGVGTHRAAEAQNPEIVLTASTPRNSSGEATDFGAVFGGQAMHAAGRAGNTPGETVSVPVQHEAGGAFDRMDAAVAPRVIESTPHRLAVGVDNGGLGWVEIHTTSAAGHVSATLASSSVESHHAIAAQLPEVREFLTGEHVRVDNLASERFSGSSRERGGSSGNQAEGGDARATRSAEQDRPSRSAAAETDSEGLSYISVRV